jgi:hypothetical protein
VRSPLQSPEAGSSGGGGGGDGIEEEGEIEEARKTGKNTGSQEQRTKVVGGSSLLS